MHADKDGTIILKTFYILLLQNFVKCKIDCILFFSSFFFTVDLSDLIIILIYSSGYLNVEEHLKNIQSNISYLSRVIIRHRLKLPCIKFIFLLSNFSFLVNNSYKNQTFQFCLYIFIKRLNDWIGIKTVCFQTRCYGHEFGSCVFFRINLAWNNK